MGRVGTATYDRLHQQYGDQVGGLERDAAKVEKHRVAGRNVILGDATDPDFWQKVDFGKIRVVLLTLPNRIENIFAVEQLRARGFNGAVTATARFADEVEELKAAGIDAVYDFYTEAGVGFADNVNEQLLKN
jgi:voltage-gated potassium channel Kch